MDEMICAKGTMCYGLLSKVTSTNDRYEQKSKVQHVHLKMTSQQRQSRASAELTIISKRNTDKADSSAYHC